MGIKNKNTTDLKKKDIVYFGRAIPDLDIYEIHKCIVRTLANDYFVISDKDTKRAYLLNYNDYNTRVFKDRKKALEYINKQEEKFK